MSDKPDPLKLAALLHYRTPWDSSTDRQAAAALRHLVEENGKLKQQGTDLVDSMARIFQVETIEQAREIARDALVKALD